MEPCAAQALRAGRHRRLYPRGKDRAADLANRLRDRQAHRSVRYRARQQWSCRSRTPALHQERNAPLVAELEEWVRGPTVTPPRRPEALILSELATRNASLVLLRNPDDLLSKIAAALHALVFVWGPDEHQTG